MHRIWHIAFPDSSCIILETKFSFEEEYFMKKFFSRPACSILCTSPVRTKFFIWSYGWVREIPARTIIVPASKNFSLVGGRLTCFVWDSAIHEWRECEVLLNHPVAYHTKPDIIVWYLQVVHVHRLESIVLSLYLVCELCFLLLRSLIRVS